MVRTPALLLFSALATGCLGEVGQMHPPPPPPANDAGATGGGGGGGDVDAGGGGGQYDAGGGGGGTDAGTPDAGPTGLPFTYTRPAEGTPETAQELADFTDVYLDLLTQTRYFDVLDERVHGWPQSDPQHRYWYGTWWSGVGFHKEQGNVSLVHVNVGADNNGIGTSAVLEGVCYADQLWRTAKLELLDRRLIRGFNSWYLAMERMPNDPNGPMLARVGYPEPITSTDFGRTVYLDYSADRPGVDSYTLYVEIPNNPYWGDLYVKNKRSKDDVGHMLRAFATLEDCRSVFGADAVADLDDTRAHYQAWAQQVENDAWSIATLDQNDNRYIPAATETLAHYYTTGNAECDAVLALRLFGRGDPGSFQCGSGVNPLESLVLSNPSNGEILRSYHEAAARQALLAGQNDAAKALLEGLASRIEEGMGQAESGQWPVHLNADLLVKLIVNSANAGVPLTAREVRWVHQQLRATHDAFVALDPKVYRVFDPATPDGDYVFTPDAAGVDFRFWAVLAGSCAARYRNPASQPLLDCAKLRMWTPP